MEEVTIKNTLTFDDDVSSILDHLGIYDSDSMFSTSVGHHDPLDPAYSHARRVIAPFIVSCRTCYWTVELFYCHGSLSVALLTRPKLQISNDVFTITSTLEWMPPFGEATRIPMTLYRNSSNQF